MARRNIFDRDTGAGYYSDALGNFLESIPSLYGQLSREKRLEKQRIEDTNYRNQTYNNQLLQQSRNNIRQDKIDRQNIDWQNFQKKDREFKSRLKMAELASINNPSAIDSFLLSEGQITQEDFNARKTTNNDYKDLIDDVDGYINMTINEQFDNYHDATDMYNRLNQKLTVLKTNSPMAKTLRDEKNKLNKALNFIKTKSGQVRPKSEWSNAVDADLYNQLTDDLKDYRKQLREINAQIIKAEAAELGDDILLPLYASKNALQVEVKDSFGKKGYEGSIPKTITELAIMGSKYKYPSIPDKPIPGDPAQSSGLADATDDDRDKIIEERNKFINSVEPLLRDDEAGLDALLDYYRDEGDESFSRLESTADILKKQLDAKAPKILGIVPDVSNEDFAGNEGDFRIIDNQPQVADPVVAEGEVVDPVVAEGGVIKPESEVVKTEPVVAEGGESKPVVKVPPPAVEASEPDQGAENILSEILPLVSAAGETPPIEEIKLENEVISDKEVVKPPVNLKEAARTREISEKYYKKLDKSYEEGWDKHNEIQDSGIRDIKGKKINFDGIGDFNKQINSMVKRVKDLQIKEGGEVSSKSRIKERQNMFEQKQIVEDLLELKDRISDLPKYIYKNRVVRGRETGEISKIDTKRFKQSIDNALKGNKYTKGLTKNIRYKDEFTPLKESRYKQALGY